MRWGLITLAALTALMLWRDLKSGRVYNPRAGQFGESGAEFYEDKAKSPLSFRVWTSLAAVAAWTGLTLGVLPAFAAESRGSWAESGGLVSIFSYAIQVVYLIYGLLGRAFSWIKNYGSADKKW